MPYLLDSDVCISTINDRPASVRRRLDREIVSGQAIAISTVTVFELQYGVAKSQWSAASADLLRAFLARTEVLPFEAIDAEAAAQIRADLERRGRPIGPYDCLIAGQAVRRGLTLVTANAREFARVPGLAWENWAE